MNIRKFIREQLEKEMEGYPIWQEEGFNAWSMAGRMIGASKDDQEHLDRLKRGSDYKFSAPKQKPKPGRKPRVKAKSSQAGVQQRQKRK